jgi:predicted NUDIX family NTP pyrophosphohydrolase
MKSAGLLLYRRRQGRIEVLLGHMGGPFWARKDERGWSIPKGEHPETEDALTAARREFAEETGTRPPDGPTLDLGEVRQSGGKRVTAWAVEGDLDPAAVRSNTFLLEWPPRSGRRQEFPEIDRAGWFDLDTARRKIVKGQVTLVDRLEARLSAAEDAAQ